MLRAIIFDFNGIILNDEPLHFRSMQGAVAALGVVISKEEYWRRYLPFDDATCLQAICRDRKIALDGDLQKRTLERKILLYQQLIRDQYPLFPGVAGFIQACSKRFLLALASGARREEIETTLRATGLIQHFLVIVGAEDFVRGKPHPESYLLALERLNNALNSHHDPIRPEECLVIEDSIGGIRGACAAGMVCLAVSNTYPPESLQAAHQVVSSLEDLKPESLDLLTREVS